MSLQTRAANLYGHWREHGVGDTVSFSLAKARAALARNDLGWKLLFENNPFVATGTVSDYGVQAESTWEQLRELAGLETRRFEIDSDAYRAYVAQANYEAFDPYYRGGESGNRLHRAEKLLQHHISLELLGIELEDVYVDVAGNTSPMKDIVRNLYGTTSYAMDLAYEEGVHGDRIGCDAGDTGLEAGFASKMSLHCAFEHFADGADMRFVKECSRLLRPGGRVCIVPLYILGEYCIRQDPTREADQRIPDLEGAKRVRVRGYNVDYGRFYSPKSFAERILAHRNDLLVTVYRIVGHEALGQDHFYSHFALLLEKPANPS